MASSRIRLWPALSPSVYVRPRVAPCFPLGNARATHWARGRHALWAGVRALRLEPGDEILVPAYHCGTEVEALIAAGLVCRFYDATDTLEPDPEELQELCSGRVRALLLIHYFGFSQDAGRWRRWCADRGLLLVEDCAHAALATRNGKPVGMDGDLAIFSLHKTVPVLEGGVAVGPVTVDDVARGHLPLAQLAKSHIRWGATRLSLLDVQLAKREGLTEPDFDLGPVRQASRASRFALTRLYSDDVAVQRRVNYERLLAVAGSRVPAPFREVSSGACPLFFPLLVGDDGSETVTTLRRAGIGAAFFWPRLHPLFEPVAFPRAAAWHEAFIAVPCHQDLAEEEVHLLETAISAL